MEDKNMLKKALEKREGNGLPFNFSYRMMEKVQLEAEKKRKRQRLIITLSLIAACLFITGLLVYFLFFYLEINVSEYVPILDIKAIKIDKSISDFYWFIGGAVVVLLGIDFWIRNRWKKHHKNTFE